MLNETITNKHKLFIIASFCAFFTFAFPYTVQGSLAPVTMVYFGISAAQQGLIVTMQAVGSLCMAVFIALKGEMFNKINVIAFGLLAVSAITLVISGVSAYPFLLVLVLLLGIAACPIDIMMNGVISETYPKQKNTLLPIVHGFFATGATCVPIVVGLVASPDEPPSFRTAYRLIGFIAIGVFLFYFANSRRVKNETPYVNMEAMKTRAIENPAEIFKTGKAWYLIVVGLLYTTFQLGTIMWLPTFTIRNAGADFGTGTLMLTLFFAGALPIRFLTPLFLRRFSPGKMYVYFTWAAVASMLVALLSENIPVMLVFVTACGFLQGGHFAILILMCCETFPERTASASSIMAFANGISALTAPFWMGLLSEHTGFQIPMILILGALFGSAVMVFLMGRKRGSSM